MTKRLIDAAQAVVSAHAPRDVTPLGNMRVAELLAALDEARQPVTVTEERAIEILQANWAALGYPFSPEEREAMTSKDRQDIAEGVTAILEKARELGL